MSAENNHNMKKGNAGIPVRKLVLLGVVLLFALLFLPTTLLLIVGLLPTFVSLFVGGKMKMMCVGTINLAGASPFLLELWERGHNFENAISLALDPKNIIVMYCAAAAGYIIDWVVTTIVMSYKAQAAKSRMKVIEKNQKKLEERWGKEVTGQYELDQAGFAIETESDAES